MGLYWGWVVCISFLLLFTLAAGIAFSFSEVMVPLNKEIHTSVALLGWLGSLPVALPMLAAPLATAIHFRLGAQRTVLIGVLVTTMAVALTAVVSHVALLFLFYGLMGGAGMMLIVNPPFFLLEEYFPYDHPRHVLATSIIACGFPLATLIFNPMTFAIMDDLGWRVTYSIYAGALLVIGICSALTFRSRTAASGDLLQYRTNEQKEQYEEILVSNVSVAKRTKFILGGLWLLASTFKSIGYYTPFVTLVKQMDVLGIPQSQSSTAMSVVGCCEVVSRLLTSYVGDYFKGKILYLYAVCAFILCLQNALGSLAYTFTQLTIYGAALGLFGGPIIAAMYSSCSEVMQRQEVPALFSLFRVGLGIGALLGPSIAGGIFDATDSFHLVFYIDSATYFMTGCLYIVIIVLNKTKPQWVFPPGTCTNSLSELDTTGIIDSMETVSDCEVDAICMEEKRNYESVQER